MIFSTGVAILTSVYPPHERGKVLGYSVATIYLGLSLGPFLGGVLTQYLTWRSIFLAPVPFGLFVIYCATVKLKGAWVETKGERFDLSGAIAYALSLLSLIYGMSILP